MYTLSLKSSISRHIWTLLFMLYLLCPANLQAVEKIRISAPPSVWVQEDKGQLSGPLIDLIEEIFAEVDIEVVSFPLPWARAISQIKNGKIDMIPVIFYTKERAEFAEFSEPFAEVPTAVFVPFGKTFKFSSVTDLMGKKGLIMQGDSISREFETLKPQLELDEIAGYDQIVHMLADQRADYAVAAQYGFTIELKKLGLESKIQRLPTPVSTRNLHFAMSKKSPFVQYLPSLNRSLQQFKAKGDLKRMVEQTIERAAER